MRNRLKLLPLLIALAAPISNALGQWATQTITLEPGWNPAYLEVQPASRDCDTLFANLPLESVWAWNRRFTPIQYIQDTNNFLPKQPDWLAYFPPTVVDSAPAWAFLADGA